jgi:hypothetical protein
MGQRLATFTEGIQMSYEIEYSKHAFFIPDPTFEKSFFTYGKENTCEKLCEKMVSYYYNGGEVAVDHIFWRGISQSDADILSRLNV